MDGKKVRSFEDLRVWQKAREMVRQIYALARNGPLARDFALRDQLCRSAISVMSNIAEGFERSSKREYANFLNIAKASCAELRSQLYVVQDVGAADSAVCDELRDCARSLSRMISSLMRHVKAEI